MARIDLARSDLFSYFPEQVRQNADVADTNRASNAEALQALEFPLQIFHGVVFIHFMGFEELGELVPGFKTQQPPQIRFGDVAAPEFLERQGFEGAPRQIATGRAHAPGEIVGNLNREFHALS
jgi:hypothetical protein